MNGNALGHEVQLNTDDNGIKVSGDVLNTYQRMQMLVVYHMIKNLSEIVGAQALEHAENDGVGASYDSKKTNNYEPKCGDCGAQFHIMDDPAELYNGKGITCFRCKRKDDKELLTDEFFCQCVIVK